MISRYFRAWGIFTALIIILGLSLVISFNTSDTIASKVPAVEEISEQNSSATPDARGLNQVVPRLTATPTRTPTPINVGNFVWDDYDQDGRQDPGEPGIMGITVQLWNAAKNNLLDSDTTDENGHYTLVAPLPGDYRVRVLLSSGDSFTVKDAVADTEDSDINPTGTDFGFTDVYTFASNLISITSIDAGIIVFRTPTPTRTPTPINIGNFVWSDLNGDGVQDAGEPGIPGITVQLWNAAKNNLLDSDITDENGIYSLIAPVPGDYRVRVVGTGLQFTLKDQGSDTTDSDINHTGPDTGFTDSFNIASNVISITSKDAGIVGYGIELLTNGNFEAKNAENKPDLTPWTLKNGTSDKVKCNKDTDGDGFVDKIVAYSGDCAMQFKGGAGENANISQNIALENFVFTAGDNLNLGVFVDAKDLATSGNVKAVIKYSDDLLEKDKITLALVQTLTYDQLEGTIALQSGELAKIKVKISHKSLSGKVFLDIVSLNLD